MAILTGYSHAGPFKWHFLTPALNLKFFRAKFVAGTFYPVFIDL